MSLRITLKRPLNQKVMERSKGCAGALMLLAGSFMVFVVLANYIAGHASTPLSPNEYWFYGAGGIALLALGVYAVATSDKKRS